MLIKTAFMILALLMTFSPGSGSISVKSEVLNPDIIRHQLKFYRNSNEIPYARDFMPGNTMNSHEKYHYNSGLQYLPNYLPGDEKPEFLPKVWKNYLKFIEAKASD